jgi:hypothetical protein
LIVVVVGEHQRAWLSAGRALDEDPPLAESELAVEVLEEGEPEQPVDAIAGRQVVDVDPKVIEAEPQ